MRNINQVVIIGRLTSDFDQNHYKVLNSGMAVADMTIAVNDSKKDASGQWVETTDFIPFKMFGKLAEVIARYAGKGRKVCVSGRLKVDTWTDTQTGQKRSKMYVMADNVELCERVENNGGQGNQQDYQQAPQQVTQGYQQPPSDGFAEDIPF